MLLRYSFPNFLASQDVTKITRDLNCKYMEVPRRHPALIPADLGQESSARKNGGREGHGRPLLIPTTLPISSMLSRQGIEGKKGFRWHLSFPSRQVAPSPILAQFENGQTVPRKGNGSWQETGIESNVIQLTATISPSDRIRGPAGNLRCSVSCPPPCSTIYTEPRFSVNTTVNLSRKEAWYTVLKQL